MSYASVSDERPLKEARCREFIATTRYKGPVAADGVQISEACSLPHTISTLACHCISGYHHNYHRDLLLKSGERTSSGLHRP